MIALQPLRQVSEPVAERDRIGTCRAAESIRAADKLVSKEAPEGGISEVFARAIARPWISPRGCLREGGGPVKMH